MYIAGLWNTKSTQFLLLLVRINTTEGKLTMLIQALDTNALEQ